MDNVWNPIETMPPDRRVLIKSRTGIECLAKAICGSARVVKGGVWCRRIGRPRSDITAVAWREIPEGWIDPPPRKRMPKKPRLTNKYQMAVMRGALEKIEHHSGLTGDGCRAIATKALEQLKRQ